MNEYSFRAGFREAPYFQMFPQKEWVPYNNHIRPGELYYSVLPPEGVFPNSLERSETTFICIHGLYMVVFPIRKRTEKDQVTLLSWACVNSCEGLSSVRKSFPGNDIHTLT